ncbi:hypothetical protein FA95DRAFT_1578536 [Auriscalpium vulgare]|uniref:Uncharacterized protein n=1 Tax=Auriscalpium vulgare TaxID=40419 RepID=A0ACB8R2A8_9AGAM|nr:hypothetical protein FA95DRAFT_1578536 [Auriscalpium vulgare]
MSKKVSQKDLERHETRIALAWRALKNAPTEQLTKNIWKKARNECAKNLTSHPMYDKLSKIFDTDKDDNIKLLDNMKYARVLEVESLGQDLWWKALKVSEEKLSKAEFVIDDNEVVDDEEDEEEEDEKMILDPTLKEVVKEDLDEIAASSQALKAHLSPEFDLAGQTIDNLTPALDQLGRLIAKEDMKYKTTGERIMTLEAQRMALLEELKD